MILNEKQTNRTNHGTVVTGGVTTEFVKDSLLLLGIVIVEATAPVDVILGKVRHHLYQKK